jgi:hypothetical protein
MTWLSPNTEQPIACACILQSFYDCSWKALQNDAGCCKYHMSGHICPGTMLQWSQRENWPKVSVLVAVTWRSTQDHPKYEAGFGFTAHSSSIKWRHLIGFFKLSAMLCLSCSLNVFIICKLCLNYGICRQHAWQQRFKDQYFAVLQRWRILH